GDGGARGAHGPGRDHSGLGPHRVGPRRVQAPARPVAMARVVAFIPDLLFGSNVVGALGAAGHETELTSDPAQAAPAEVLVVDLTADVDERIAKLETLDLSSTKTLAFYSHVETEVREKAQAAGLDLVVPRSRMAREGAALVTRLADSAAE